MEARRRQILAGARQAFTELGYERASVDAIAARAGVAKATVYNHFEDKASLFVACFSEQADALRAELAGALGEPAGRVEDALQAAGEKLMTVLLSPAIVGLYRHTIAEAARFPEIGRMLFDRGPHAVHEHLGRWLRRWHERDALRVPDPRAAGVHFAMLCQGDLMLRAQLGILEAPAEREIRDTVRRGVAVFLRAHRP
jgi:AcrR family transcriptional regulator